jgi:ankyrin repeat protein
VGVGRAPPGPREGLSPPPKAQELSRLWLFLGLSSGPQAQEGDAISTSLPERPDLDQLRRQAKKLRDAARGGSAAALERFGRQHLSAPKDPVSLAAAQLVVARELGFTSWPKLKAAVDAATATSDRLGEFAAASVEGRLRTARAIFDADPEIARRSLLAATVLGDASEVRERLAVDPAAGVTLDDERGWPPLLYACYSHWHQIDPGREEGLAEVVRLLLASGASARTNDGGRPRYRSALKGSVEVDNPSVTEVLLDAGANPDDGESIGEAAAHGRHRCLESLLTHGARVTSTWALGAAVWADDPVAMRMLLEALARNGAAVSDHATATLLDAAGDASMAVIEVLLAAGADPETGDPDGVSALRKAVRSGHVDTAARLRQLGVPDNSTDLEQFLGACLAGDRHQAERLLAERSDLPDRLRAEDRALIVEAAGSRPPETIALMLDMAFSVDDHNDLGERPLHNAAYAGKAEVVRLLLQRGADVDARDDRFDSTALAFATVGSGEQSGRPGDWVESVRLLVDAGASRDRGWVPGKPPSEEVMNLVQMYGFSADGPTEATDEPTPQPASLGTGVMAEIARHLEAAYRERDLDVLGSLLHPQVRWTGLCRDRAQVLDWYRGLLAEGTVATVEGVEVDRDAVVLGLSVARSAEGARPAPAQRLYQVFSIQDEQVIEIRGYPDRTSAFERT